MNLRRAETNIAEYKAIMPLNQHHSGWVANMTEGSIESQPLQLAVEPIKEEAHDETETMMDAKSTLQQSDKGDNNRIQYLDQELKSDYQLSAAAEARLNS